MEGAAKVDQPATIEKLALLPMGFWELYQGILEQGLDFSYERVANYMYLDAIPQSYVSMDSR
jgi:hypothetical protein